MSRLHHVLLPFLLLLAAAGSAASASSPPKVSPAEATGFVRRCCRATSYPRACERSLVPRAPSVGLSPRRLAQAALAAAADAARNCSAYIGSPSSSYASSKGKGGGAMGDCAETVRDAADLLKQSAAELGGRVGRASSPRFAWCLSNVQTWASAALTDAETCLDSLSTYAGGAPREDVKRRVVAVEQAAGIALALVNRLQPARRPATATAVHQ
ncbi:pectinesterase inhibitor 11-like [Triticum dicoccoides]|uniref:pectinesterase inhibitor 11-like n=1 Tax=Triticum dicoccoides TaxID=85692 RepID=UPI00188E0D62|nr:pectinesterase inhibitor 11-like [Triticum dicoccoides]